MFADRGIISENYDAMAKFVRRLDETRYDFEGKVKYMYADWLSYQKFETCGNSFGNWKKWQDDAEARNYRRFLAACYWRDDARMMSEMAKALGRDGDAEYFAASSERALAHIRKTFLDDGLLPEYMRELQTACLFALHFGVVEGEARERTKADLLKSVRDHGDCLQTGFLGTSVLMDTLTEIGSADVAYTLLFQRKNPSWLYSVDQGATTIWERWNSYTKEEGFNPMSMNSFNHYAYGAVLAWIYKTAAGIAPDPENPGFRKITMAPVPDRRLGFVEAEYKSNAGLVKSAWRYEGDRWIWRFSVPEGATAAVKAPGDAEFAEYLPGTYEIVRSGVR
jgi:alpha-L-rhamnosidase